MSFQCLTLESSSYCTFTWCRVKFPGSQCLGTLDNVTKNNIIEFNRIIPRELLIYKKPNRVNAV
ncbi:MULTISPECIES: hypothetical protein [unclassified Wolbachia]|uniref:hypothetical protein n=1 Tax=unclassified Wolbachia TaxID=2640676 RepID=UPI003132A23E|nr:hypothetical protein [Wolbachia endosymbiont of Pissodes strobi]